ncbi:MAG: transglycosylase domain-containing protein [Ignavibacteriales bacterium]
MLSIAFALAALLIVIIPLPPPETPLASMLYDRNGEVFGRLFVQNRTEIPLSQMPADLRNAVIAVEDYRFYKHPGIDPIAIARALVVDIREGRIVEGASTITQQLARTLYLSAERRLSRKLIEALLALKLELKYTKDEILGMYLNQIYFGAGAYGVEAASWTYFGTAAKDLDLPRAALLAGLIRAPESYSPFRNPELAARRRDNVLKRMNELGYVDESGLRAAVSSQLGTRPRPVPLIEAPYFADYVLEQVRQADPALASDLDRGGYRVYTTLDMKAQRSAERAVAQIQKSGTDAAGVVQPQMALVAMDPSSGQIRAMVGGRDYSNTSLNRAVQSLRQPGSMFKPFVYAAALDRGHPPTAVKVCEPVTYPGKDPEHPYQPADYGDEKYHYRPITMREAIMISDNVVAVRWIEQVGPGTAASYARRMGIQSPLNENLSLALGSSEITPLEAAAAFSALANSGFRVEPSALLRVEDRWGRIVLEKKARPPTRALDENVAYILTDLMKGVTSPGGTAGSVQGNLGRPVAGKTGTTDDFRDAWFVGFTPDLVGVVYVGYDHREKAVGSGGSVAAPVWQSFASGALEGTPVSDFARPAGVVDRWVCTETGLLVNPTCPARSELFIQGTEPQWVCPLPHYWPSLGHLPEDDLDSERLAAPPDSRGDRVPDAMGR